MQSPDTFLPLTRMRDELRVPAGVSEGDNRLLAHRDGAIAWIENYTGQPVIDRSEAVFRPCPPVGQGRIEAVRRPHIRSVEAIRYWETGGESEAPDGALTDDDIPRYVSLPDDAGVTIFAPSNGWPQMVADAGVWIVLKAGIAETHRFASTVRDAGIAYIRHQWNGAREVRPTDAFVSLLRPVRDFAEGLPQFFPDTWEGAVPDDGTGVRLTYGGAGLTYGGVGLLF